MMFSCGEKHANPFIQDLNDSWNVTTDTLDINMQVDVPSVIIADMYENGLIPHPYYSDVEPQLQWIPQREWVYTMNFDAEENIMNEDVIELVFEGLDTYADVWLNAPTTTLDALMQMDSRHNLFRSAREGRVYGFYLRTLPDGANDFWESAVARPDLVLKDIIWALHPQLLPDYQPTYILKLQ